MPSSALKPVSPGCLRGIKPSSGTSTVSEPPAPKTNAKRKAKANAKSKSKGKGKTKPNAGQ